MNGTHCGKAERAWNRSCPHQRLRLWAPMCPGSKRAQLLFISGQITMGIEGLEYVGIVGEDINLEDGVKAARLAALNVIAQAAAALAGDLDRVTRVVKVTGFVNTAPEFTQHPEVVNGASDLVRRGLRRGGTARKGGRGLSSLPRNVAVEIEAIFEVA